LFEFGLLEPTTPPNSIERVSIPQAPDANDWPFFHRQPHDWPFPLFPSPLYLISSTAHLVTLWRDTGAHAAREEAKAVELAATDFEMGTTRFFVANLGVLKDSGDPLQVGLALVRIQPPRTHQRIGGVAELAHADRWVFPPEAAPFRGLRRDDSSS
jgi:hypothetical protein